jgi:hypothetical protein
MTRRTRERDPRKRYEVAARQEELRIGELEHARTVANTKSAALIDVSIDSRRRMLGVYRARLLELEESHEQVIQ